ncbi:MAG TPA: flagellar hook-associated protein FlgL [Gemmatimonadaceae bacterium]|nr:flagellar hook-associated protein FlgL [Gemmatimonadaceae bacterium]
MRITNNMMAQAQLDGLSLNMTALMKAQAQVSSGNRLQAASDDPSAATQIVATSSSLAALDQYVTNVQRASSRVSTEDSVLQQINDILARAKQIGVQQATATATDQTRLGAAAEVNQLFQQIVSLGNTKFGDEYLFGGDQSQTEPFAATGAGATLDYTASSTPGGRSINTGDGQTLQISHTGKQLLQDTGVLDAVKQLARSLDPKSSTYGQDGIGAAMTSVDQALTSIQGVVGDVGATAQKLDVTQQNLDAYKTNLTTFKSNLSDVDVETAVTELTNRQMAYQAAMLATSKVMGLTLTDYLK